MSKETFVPLALNVDTVRDYILSKGGKVYNIDLVKYFKPLLTHPEHKGMLLSNFVYIFNN